MKRFFSLLSIFTIFTLFNFLLIKDEVKAQDACTSKVIVHYHRHNEDYDDMELYAFDYGGEGKSFQATSTDAFGQVYEVPVCGNAKDNIGIILKKEGSWDYKDGIDTDNNGVDDKLIDVTDLRGSSNSMHVYVIQGSADVYLQDPLKATYFGKANMGNVVVVYYNPAGNEGWDDIWTWGTGTGAKNDDVLLEYNLGIDGGNDPDLFRVGIINIASDADDQIGFVARKGKSWDEKDAAWANNLTEDTTDELGHTYKINGDRLINVTDVKGGGYKFIYVINGVHTFFEDYDKFVAEAFKLEFTKAEFRSLTTLTITFNQAITYDSAIGPDKTKFTLTEDDGEIIPIDKITYNSLKSSDTTFNIIFSEDIETDDEYTLVYRYEQFGEEKQAEAKVTFAPGLIPEDDDDIERNLTPYIIAGIAALVALGVGAALLFRRRK